MLFPLAYLLLTLVRSKGQGQRRAHCGYEYLVNGDRYRANIAMIANKQDNVLSICIFKVDT